VPFVSCVFRDSLFDAQWLRAAGHASSGGAEVGECFAAAGRIREVDAQSWYDAWWSLGESLLEQADKSRAAGRDASAISAYLRASNYFRAAYTFLIGEPVDPRVVEGYRLQRSAFEAAGALMTPAAERVAIPYGGRALHGYLFRPPGDGLPRPTLIITGGYDSTAEELYFFSGAAAVARGYNCLVYDGPGQGAAIVEDRLVFRPDWEVVVGPVVDFALTRPEVDPARIALLGMSFGGYLAPRAASGEPRLAACIADPGEFSLFEELKSRLPAFVSRQLFDGNRSILALFEFLVSRRLPHTTAGWGLRRCLWVHGVKDPMAYFQLTQQYTLAGRVEQIRCPTLVCSAEKDEIGASADKLYAGLTCEKARVTFTAKEGAAAHCESGARSVFNQRAFDWLDSVLGRPMF
jgi:predicted alpha/beta hydrolase